MAARAGVGAETIACARPAGALHHAQRSGAGGTSYAGIDCQLTHRWEFIWFGKSSAEICAQMKDPKRNGGRDAVGLLFICGVMPALSGFVPRGWAPAPAAATPPRTFEDHVRDMALWGAAGQPCPN